MSLTLRQIVDMASKRVPNSETDQTCVDFLNQLQNRLYRLFSFPMQIEQMPTVANQALYTLSSYIKPDRIKNLVLTNADGSSPQQYEYASPDDDLVSNAYFKIETELSIMIGLNPAPLYSSIQPPTTAPTLTAVAGSTGLTAGTYTVAYSYVNAGGQETPVGPTATVTITTGQGIQVSALTLPANVTKINYYMSTAAGGATLGYVTQGTGTQITLTAYGNTTVPQTSNNTGQLIIITFEDGPNALDSSNMTTVPRFFYDYHMLFVYALASELAKIRKDIVLANNYANDYQELLNEALITYSDQDAIEVKVQW